MWKWKSKKHRELIWENDNLYTEVNELRERLADEQRAHREVLCELEEMKNDK